mgnify:CR=1 FL=1
MIIAIRTAVTPITTLTMGIIAVTQDTVEITVDTAKDIIVVPIKKWKLIYFF